MARRTWKISLLSRINKIIWTECDAHLVTFTNESTPLSWPVTVDARSLSEIIPDLEKAEDERKNKSNNKSKSESKEQSKRRSNGNPVSQRP